MPPRITPLDPPYTEDVANLLEGIMPPGQEPLKLFRTIARNPRIFARFKAGSLLDRGLLSLRQREIVIDRVTARLGAEYEWGIHIAIFAKKAGLSTEQIHATLEKNISTELWTEDEQSLLSAVDELIDARRWQDKTYGKLSTFFSAEQILEIISLVGFYTTVSLYINALGIENEPGVPRFPVSAAPAAD